MQAGASKLADRKSGQMNFFDEIEEEIAQQAGAAAQNLPDLPEFPKKALVAMEKEVA